MSASTTKIISEQGKKWFDKGWTKIGGLGGAVGIGMGVMDYADRRKNGQGVVGAAAGAVATDIFYGAMGLAGGLAFGAAQAGIALAPAASQAYRGYSQSLARMNRPFSHGYQDTQSAYTMRQRSLQVMQQSKTNARSALGNEAQYMHR